MVTPAVTVGVGPVADAADGFGPMSWLTVLSPCGCCRVRRGRGDRDPCADGRGGTRCCCYRGGRARRVRELQGGSGARACGLGGCG